jgi:hypothetical protein
MPLSCRIGATSLVCVYTYQEAFLKLHVEASTGCFSCLLPAPLHMDNLTSKGWLASTVGFGESCAKINDIGLGYKVSIVPSGQTFSSAKSHNITHIISRASHHTGSGGSFSLQ